MNNNSNRDGGNRNEGRPNQASSDERNHGPPPAPAAAGDEDGTPRGGNIDDREASRGSSPMRALPLPVSVPTKTEDGGSASMAGSGRGGYDAFRHYSDNRVRMARLLGLGVEDGGAAAHEGVHAHRHGHGDAHMVREEGADRAAMEDEANDVNREGGREEANDNQINADRAENGREGRYNANDDDEDRDGGNQGDANGDEVMEEANRVPRRMTRLSWEVHGNALYDRWFRDV